MSALYEQLRTAGSDRARRAITDAVIDTMRVRPGSTAANEAYYGLCETVIHRLGYGATAISSKYAGQLPPLASALLVLTAPRVRGFLTAIHQAERMNSVVEAGPGTSALFSVAAARRGAQVVAYEIHPEAAECAKEVIKLTGYAQQVRIIAGDVLTAALPRHADIAIAEILGAGLRGEVGPAVIAALKNHA